MVHVGSGSAPGHLDCGGLRRGPKRGMPGLDDRSGTGGRSLEQTSWFEGRLARCRPQQKTTESKHEHLPGAMTPLLARQGYEEHRPRSCQEGHTDRGHNLPPGAPDAEDPAGHAKAHERHQQGGEQV